MVFRMARPAKRNNSANAQFRQRVPTDLVETLRGQVFVVRLPVELGSSDTIMVQSKIGETIVFSLRTTQGPLLKARYAAAQQQVNAFFEAARRGPEDLTFKQINALCGELYRHIVTPREENPPTAIELEIMAGDALEARYNTAHGTEAGRQRAIAAVSKWLDLEAFIAGTATSLSIALSERSRIDFLEAMPDTLAEAVKVLNMRRAANYAPDPTPARYAPLLVPPNPSSVGSVQNFEDLFEKWKSSDNHAPATLTRWRGILKRFKAFVGHDDPRRVTEADANRWKDDLLAAGLQRIDMSFIAAMRRLYGYSVENAPTTGIYENPFAKVKADQKAVAGTKRKTFTSEEVALILTAARKEKAPYLRWIPWLQAGSGARVAEIAQLWGSMITVEDGVHCIQITPAPDGGRLKNAGSERTIPIHPTIIKDGFLDFVKERGNGPLFYGGAQAKPSVRRSDEQKHPSKGVSNRLAAWVRDLGITDPRKAPNHSWRRWVKRELTRKGSDRLADAVQGHAPKSEGDKYYDAELGDMLLAVSKIDLEAAANWKPSIDPPEGD